MRELRENVRYRPSRDRYKVFIIDEAHQSLKMPKQIKKQREYRTFALPYWRFGTHFSSHPLEGVFFVLSLFIIF